jgi:endonuclease YncB( thermonuclease family)
VTPVRQSTHDRPIGQTEGHAIDGEGGTSDGWKKFFLAVALNLTVAAHALSPCDYTWTVPVTSVIQVVDGSTIKANVRSWGKKTVKATIRLARVETPGLGSKDLVQQDLAIRAKQFTEKALADTEQIFVAVLGHDEYPKAVLCEIFYVVKGKTFCLSDELVDAGLAQKGLRAGGE